jgi:choline dehydrogenase-like flavoprotein
MTYDVAIVGGEPAGLAAALTLGRARKRVLLCDAGSRRNAAAVHVHNFVTRDGVTPDEFRTIARQQLEPYRNVVVRDAHVAEVTGERGAFDVRLAGNTVNARRVLLCTGMIDEIPAIDGGRGWRHARTRRAVRAPQAAAGGARALTGSGARQQGVRASGRDHAGDFRSGCLRSRRPGVADPGRPGRVVVGGCRDPRAATLNHELTAEQANAGALTW